MQRRVAAAPLSPLSAKQQPVVSRASQPSLRPAACSCLPTWILNGENAVLEEQPDLHWCAARCRPMRRPARRRQK